MHERKLRKNMHISLNWRSKREWIQIWLLHVEQTNLCIHCFEFEILVRVCIKLGDFRQTQMKINYVILLQWYTLDPSPGAVPVGTMATYILGLC